MRQRKLANRMKAVGLSIALAAPLLSCHTEKRAEQPTYADIQQERLGTLAIQFEKDPSHYNLSLLGKRLGYVEQRSQGTHADEYKKEKGELLGWFASLGIKSKDATSAFQQLNAGLLMLQDSYYRLDAENPVLREYMTGINPRMSMICKKRFSEVDARTAKLFDGISAEDPDYFDKISERARTFLAPAKVMQGKGIWASDYYPELAPQRADVEQDPADTNAYDHLALLPPLSAVAFVDYYATAQEYGLRSDEEAMSVTRTAKTLHAVNPLLVVKYFQALRNLADECEDDRKGFERKLHRLQVKVEAEAKPFSTDAPVVERDYRAAINRLDNLIQEAGKSC